MNATAVVTHEYWLPKHLYAIGCVGRALGHARWAAAPHVLVVHDLRPIRLATAIAVHTRNLCGARGCGCGELAKEVIKHTRTRCLNRHLARPLAGCACACNLLGIAGGERLFRGASVCCLY